MERDTREMPGYQVKIRCREEIHRLMGDSGSSLLTELGKQEKFLLKMAVIQNECIHPDCDNKFNQLEGCKEEVYDLGQCSNTFACPKCGQECRVIVPFWNVGQPWHWGKPKKEESNDDAVAAE